MALSVPQAFDTLLQRLTPLQSDRDAKAKHRASVEASLKGAASFDVQLFRETGSFTHGTGVRGHCDVDLLASMTGKPASSDTALRWVKDTLSASFPYTTVVIRRPTVVVEFAAGDETWEILPGFRTSAQNETPAYDIPGAASGWMSSAPTAHLDYVNEVNGQNGIVGCAKKLARLAKAWKYYNSVPISSFYLEMRAAQYMGVQASFIAASHLCGYLEWLDKNALADMNDPKGIASRFSACSSIATRTTALSNLNTAAARARKALDAQQAGNMPNAFYYWNLLFGGKFPSR
ncbi:SMODS domain-containing nucleotidyltransferase [Streptomyces sp. NBC_00658]|uniref:SMODS domain-containing nucleotidyltransferase n=1 Tax=Streptomyces sp. NBC_00658 TaxID=2975800 RepID=UPI00324D1B94